MDQPNVTMGAPPQMPAKKGWAWWQWTLLGCGGLLAFVLVVGAIGGYLIYRNVSMTTDPATAESSAQTILQFEKPAGYTGVMAGSFMGIKMATLVAQGGTGTERGAIMLMTMPPSMSTEQAERQLRDRMQQPGQNGLREVRGSRPDETFKVRGEDTPAHVALLETNKGVEGAPVKVVQYTLTVKGSDGKLVLLLVMGPEGTTTHDSVQNFLNTVK